MPFLVPLRRTAGALLVVLLGCGAARAERCVTAGPRYNLVADVVPWSMRVESGHRCIRGVRYGNVEFENLTLILPPHSGEVALLGWGFTYTADEGFQGQDQFVIGVSGKIKKMHGTSTIRVFVSVVQSEPSHAAVLHRMSPAQSLKPIQTSGGRPVGEVKNAPLL